MSLGAETAPALRASGRVDWDGERAEVLERATAAVGWSLPRVMLVFAPRFERRSRCFGCLGTECERYRAAPEYDLTCPSRAEPVYYKSFIEEMMSERLSELAAEALRTPGMRAKVAA